MSKQVSNEIIEEFLQGSDPQKYIVAIEAGYNEPHVTLVVNDPESGKRLETHPFKPFLWFKHELTEILYGGKRTKIIDAGRKYGVKITGLKTDNDEGYSPERLQNGFKYIATCNKSYYELINFFKYGGIDLFDKEFSSLISSSKIVTFLGASCVKLAKDLSAILFSATII